MTQDETSKQLTEFGWIVEPLVTGGVRLRTRVARRMASVALLLILMLLLAPFACCFYFLYGKGESLNPPDIGVFGVVINWIIGNPLVVVAIALSAVVVQIAWLFLVHEEWFVRDNLLEIRKGIFGIYWATAYSNAELQIECAGNKEPNPAWRLAILSAGTRQYLITDTKISVHGAGLESSREEIEAVARLIAMYTHWLVQSPP